MFLHVVRLVKQAEHIIYGSHRLSHWQVETVLTVALSHEDIALVILLSSLASRRKSCYILFCHNLEAVFIDVAYHEESKISSIFGERCSLVEHIFVVDLFKLCYSNRIHILLTLIDCASERVALNLVWSTLGHLHLATFTLEP